MPTAVRPGVKARPPRRGAAARAARLELALAVLGVGVFEWDVERGAVECDELAHAVLGLPSGGALTVGAWRERFHPDDLPAYDAALVAFFERQAARFEHELRCRAGGATWRWVRQHGVAVRDAGGRVVALVGTLADVTAQKEREREHAREKQILETTLEHIDQGITMVDRDLHTIALNRRFLELLDLPPERFARGFHMADAFRFNAERGEYGPGDVEEQVRTRLELAGRFEPHAFERVRPDGRTIAIRGQPLPGGGFVSSYTDVTEQRRAEQALRESEERYALATRAAVAWVYEWDVGSGRLFLSERPRTFFCLPEQDITPAYWISRIHRDDLGAYDAAMREHFAGRTPQLEREYRVLDAEGEWRWVAERGVGVRDARGRVVKVVGALSDVTRRKRAELELRRARDVAELSLAEQTAVRQVLEALSRSAFDLDAVLRTLIESTARLAQAEKGFIFRRDGDVFRLAVDYGASDAFRAFIGANPIRLDPGSLVGRTALEGTTVHIEDAATDPRYHWSRSQQLGGFRTMLGVPIGRPGDVVGVIALWKERVEPFTPAQIALVSGFSTQAFIAIENARLFDATREALDFQKASSEILASISGSIADAQPVFEAIVRSGLPLFGDAAICVALPRDGQVHAAAVAEADPRRAAAWRARFPFPLSPDYMHGTAIIEGCVVDVPDVAAAPPRWAAGAANFLASGYRAITIVPLLRGDAALGALSVVRRTSGPLSDKQMRLLQTFADQAVIAIENVRLFNETREALEQQTASAGILSAISSSIADTQPVFQKILESCQRLFEGNKVGVTLATPDNQVVLAAYEGEHKVETMAMYPMPLSRESGTGCCILDRQVVHFPDVKEGSAPPQVVRGSVTTGFRAILFAPMIFEGRGIGAVWVARRAPGAFIDKHIALLKTFADQAVIAIQNARLFNETREALEQQKASAEVLGAISSSMADAQPVFDKIVESCQRLFAGRTVGLNLVGADGMVHLGAFQGPQRPEFEKIFPVPFNPHWATGRAITEQRAVQYPDVENGADVPPPTRRGCAVIGVKSVVFVPVLWQGRGLGSIFAGRAQPGSFSDKEIGLLKVFADQAAIAIQNARLLKETEEKGRQLEEANRHKSQFLASMSHELRTPLNAIIGFTRIVLRRTREQIDRQQSDNLEKILASGQHLLALINAVLDLSKIEAGRVDVVAAEVRLPAVLEQCLRTVEPLVDADAVALVRDWDAALLPPLSSDEEKLRQIVINLLSNAAKFTRRGRIVLRAAARDGRVEVEVEDTGIGIAPERLGAVFEEFEQADSGTTREHGGTGLGLTIARRLARLLGGDVTATSVPGGGSTFTLALPLRYAGPSQRAS